MAVVGDLTREFQRTGRRYETAVPVLLRWLPQVSYRPLQADIVHALAVPWAKRTAARPLIERFRSLPPHQADRRVRPAGGVHLAGTDSARLTNARPGDGPERF